MVEVPGKHFLYNLAYHVEAHLTGIRREANLIPPHCNRGNHTTMFRFSVFHEFDSSEYL